MANLDDIKRLDQEIRAAECNAMINLADHLREAVRDIPSQSNLALYFVQHAKAIENLADSSAIYCDWTLQQLEREAEKLLDGEGPEDLEREGGPPVRPHGALSRSAAAEERYCKDNEAREAWFRTPASARRSLILRVLGDERLIVDELALRLNAELGYPAGNGPEKAPTAAYAEDIRRLARRMFLARQLERVEEPAPGCKIRHRYFAKQEGSE